MKSLRVVESKHPVFGTAPGMGQWHGDGSLWPDHKGGWLWPKQIYRYVENPTDPLRFQAPDGKLYRPAKPNFLTDMGSIPRLVQVIYAKDGFLRSYLLHDSGFLYHKMLVSTDGGVTWQEQTLSRDQVDELLRQGIVAPPEGGTTQDADIIWWFVHKCGKKLWESHNEEGD